MKKNKYVSIHGGHSGEFCSHATDTLEEIILKYIQSGFEWVGITEHIYPLSNQLRYPDEVVADIDVTTLAARFSQYMRICRALQEKYIDRITIFTGFETESYTGYKEFIPSMIQQFKPDYVVGSVHHIPVYDPSNDQIEDICIDYSKDNYNRAASLLNESYDLGERFAFSGIDKLYCQYFDIQYEMIQHIEPAVVGHFDLIRIFDKDYPERITEPVIWERIARNLELIKKKNLIMDFNLRALTKGASEPYISAPILAAAKKMGISVVIGDDSHGVKDIGVNMEKGIDILGRAGFNAEFSRPSLYI